jgi:hypothetical protein
MIILPNFELLQLHLYIEHMYSVCTQKLFFICTDDHRQLGGYKIMTKTHVVSKDQKCGI